MATVSSIAIGCLGREFKRTIRYKSKFSKFFITLPPELPQKEVEGCTEDAAIKAFDKAILDYTKSVTKKEKVILYNYRVAAYLTRPNDDPNDWDVVFDSSDHDFGERYGWDKGIKIKLWVAVCEKTTRIFSEGKDLVTYEEIEENTISKGLQVGSRGRWDYEDAKEVLWSAEMEAFFARIGEGFEKLILQLNEVLGSTEGLTQFLVAGQKLLTD